MLLDRPRGLPLLRELLETRHAALGLDANRIVLRQIPDQAPEAIAKLEREVGGGRADELADVVGCDGVTRSEALGQFGAAHTPRPCRLTRAISLSESIFAWTAVLIADSSPISQA